MRSDLMTAAAAVALGAALLTGQTQPASPTVVQVRVPDGGIQPRVVAERGLVHLVYYRGEASHGELFYASSADGGTSFPKPVRVSSPGSAIAAGTVRGAQIALGRNGRVHVAWNGSRPAAPDVETPPMLYTRLNDAATGFEPERNVMRDAYNIDGGGAVAADGEGHVYVVWHANAPGGHEEGRRRVWVARSLDEGRTFERERAAAGESTGACGCCGLGALADRRGTLHILYRTAFEVVNRDMHLLTSTDFGARFYAAKIDRWHAGACVMSTQAFAESPAGVWAAWETKGQIYVGRIDRRTRQLTRVTEAPGSDRSRKHPSLAVNGTGDVLLAWTEETAWNKGGSAAWQVFDTTGAARGPLGRAGGVPVWSLVAASPRPDGRFAVIY